MKNKLTYITLGIGLLILSLLGILFAFNTTPIPEITPYVEKAGSEYENDQKTEMLQNFWRSEKLAVIYGNENKNNKDKYKELIQRLRWVRYTDEVTYHPLIESEAGMEAHLQKKQALLLAGTLDNHPLIKKLLSEAAPFELTENAIKMEADSYSLNEFSLIAMLPNPIYPEWPIFIITGKHSQAIVDNLSSRRLMFDYQIFERGQRVRMGSFNYKGTGIDVDSQKDYNFRRDLKRSANNEIFKIYVHKKTPDELNGDSLLQALTQRYHAVSNYLGLKRSTMAPIKYYVYSSFEDQALFSSKMEFAAVNHADNEIHTVQQTGFEGHKLADEVYIMLRDILGEPSHPLLETGLKMKFTEEWHKIDWRTMAARIARTGKDLELEKLFDTGFWERQSPVWRQPVAGAVVAFLTDEWGRDAFVTFYREGEQKINWNEMNSRWEQYLINLADRFPPEKDIGNKSDPGFLKGFNFSHEGYQIINGYGSKLADESLDKIVDLKANSVAINPFGFLREMKRPVPVNFSNRVGSENDAAVVHTIQSAQQKGLTVLLKPHIWIRRSWPGEIEMQSESEWQQFFDYYEQWIRHYAILAQLYETEIFSVGLEMTKVTTTHGKDFIEMVDRIRFLYDGKLTYAANWYGEFDQVGFWKKFDYIGLDSYFPLSKDKNSTLEDLVEGAEEVADKIETISGKFDRQVLITEIGFTSTKSPWIDPHEYARGKQVDLKDQFTSYEAIRLAWQDEPWLKGIYWWKWPTAPERGGGEHSGFTPRQKPAERVVEHWYTE